MVRIYLCFCALCSAVFLIGCNAKMSGLTERITTARVVTPNACSGWEKLELKGRSRYHLMQHDQRLLVNIEAHNLRGRDLGCWK